MDSDADRLASLRATGESFTTSAGQVWAVFDRPAFDSEGQFVPVKNRRPHVTLRTSDVEAHKLVRQSVLVRDADGQTYFVRDIEHDGTGITAVMLGA